MIAKPDKKHIERWELERFCRLRKLYPAGEPVPGEEPDFTLPVGEGRTLGIELTALHREVPRGTSPPQAHEALRHRIVQRARQLHEATAAVPLHVSVLFSAAELTKARVQILAKFIAGIVGENVPPTGEVRRLENDGLSDDFPEELHSIGIYNLPNASDRSLRHPAPPGLRRSDRKMSSGP
jgi:hypothetical protein